MDEQAPVIWWVRRALRLADNPALLAAVETGAPVVPVFILDPETEALGAAPKWRLGAGLAAFAAALGEKGTRLVLRRGPALEVLRALISETGARQVVWDRAYDPTAVARDTAVKAGLKEAGIAAASVAGHLLFEPWSVHTKTGGFFKVYTPFWRAVQGRDVPAPSGPPARLPAPARWPASDALADWHLGAAMQRGAAVVAAHACVGEARAADRLAGFLESRVANYARLRDVPAARATSRLSENLTWGEISPRMAWAGGQRALAEGAAGAETFLKELVWREFAWHLLWHSPHLAERNWREGWEGFAWNPDESRPEVLAWKQGRTGIAIVDAGMRELHITGTMHNRVRMLVASFLTKHLLAHWQIGLRFFAEHLIDWDPASNAMGWQWVAGSGPDAAPYFRIFNPDTQAEKFDPQGLYRRTYLAEGQRAPGPEALSYYAAIPLSWGLAPTDRPVRPVIGLAEGRARALAAWQERAKA